MFPKVTSLKHVWLNKNVCVYVSLFVSMIVFFVPMLVFFVHRLVFFVPRLVFFVPI